MSDDNYSNEIIDINYIDYCESSSSEDGSIEDINKIYDNYNFLACESPILEEMSLIENNSHKGKDKKNINKFEKNFKFLNEDKKIMKLNMEEKGIKVCPFCAKKFTVKSEKIKRRHIFDCLKTETEKFYYENNKRMRDCKRKPK
jgi:hypothetical protein